MKVDVKVDPLDSEGRSEQLTGRRRADAFLAEVQRRARLATAAQTRHAVDLVLSCLAENLPDGWADHLAAELPPEIGRTLRDGCRVTPPGRPRLGLFVTRLATRAALPAAQAGQLARAVFDTVRLTCDPGLLGRVCATFPDDVLGVLDHDAGGASARSDSRSYELVRVGGGARRNVVRRPASSVSTMDCEPGAGLV